MEVSLEVEKIVKKAVSETIKELKKQRLLNEPFDYSMISATLFGFYAEPEKYPEISVALKEIEADYYFGIIPLYYQQRHTLEKLAEIYDVEVSTIARNKKRLCEKISQIIRPS